MNVWRYKELMLSLQVLRAYKALIIKHRNNCMYPWSSSVMVLKISTTEMLVPLNTYIMVQYSSLVYGTSTVSGLVCTGSNCGTRMALSQKITVWMIKALISEFTMINLSFSKHSDANINLDTPDYYMYVPQSLSVKDTVHVQYTTQRHEHFSLPAAQSA